MSSSSTTVNCKSPGNPETCACNATLSIINLNLRLAPQTQALLAEVASCDLDAPELKDPDSE